MRHASNIESERPKVYYSIFDGLTRTLPSSQGSRTWSKIVLFLTNEDDREKTPDKHSVPLISFAKFSGNRGLNSIEMVTAIPLDFDDGTAYETIRELGKHIEFVAYSTHMGGTLILT
jgi:hypothetical protein